MQSNRSRSKSRFSNENIGCIWNVFLCFSIMFWRRMNEENGEGGNTFQFPFCFSILLVNITFSYVLSYFRHKEVYLLHTYVLLNSLVFDIFEAAWQMYAWTRFQPTVFIFVMLILFYITNSFSWRPDSQNCPSYKINFTFFRKLSSHHCWGTGL